MLRYGVTEPDPFGMPGPNLPSMEELARSSTDRIRVAVYMRVSTKTRQDPTLSIPGQLENCRAALPSNFEIVACFYDVETSRMELDARGYGSAHEEFDIPVHRDGGLADLLQEAVYPNRRFDAVMVESIDRAARWTYQSTHIEHILEQAEVPYFAADEGDVSLEAPRSSQILTRRIKQGVAEWYIREMLEKSWRGFKEHTRQGWNVGKPPHGLLAVSVPHPVETKRLEGLTKTRLASDPKHSPSVVHIYHLRHDHQLSYRNISELLNEDLDQWPPPQPIVSRRARHCWTPSSVRDILTNPKFTGYMVWNRRATKKGGKVNPPHMWIWSPVPTHEALVDLETWQAVQKMGNARKGSRHEITNKHPATRRSYLMRTYLHHASCGGRMFGKTRRQHVYYSCQPRPERVGKPENYRDHPSSVYLREDALLECVEKLFAQRVLGRDRVHYLNAALAGHETRHDDEETRRVTTLEAAITDVARRQDKLIAELEETENDELGQAWSRRIRARFAELETTRREKQDQLDELKKNTTAELPPRPELLDALPQLSIELTNAPDHLQRALYDACKLNIQYDHARRHLTISITLQADTVPAVNATLAEITTTNATPGNATVTTSRRQKKLPFLVAPRRGHKFRGLSLLAERTSHSKLVIIVRRFAPHGRGASPPPLPLGRFVASAPCGRGVAYPTGELVNSENAEIPRDTLQVVDSFVRQFGADRRPLLAVLDKLTRESVSFDDLIRDSALPRRIIEDLLAALNGDVSQSAVGYTITAKHRAAYRRRFSPTDQPSALRDTYPAFSEADTDLLRKMEKIIAEGPAPRKALDHVSATPETVVRRAKWLDNSYWLDDSRLLFVGDHDLTSVATALVNRKAKLAVADIDERILNYIAKLSDEHGLDIECLYADFQLGLPPPLREWADLVITDPPYTPEGLQTFLTRGMESLRDLEHGRLVVAYGFSARKPTLGLQCQQAMTRLGLVFEAILPGFNRYFGAQAVGSASDLYVCRPTAKAKKALRRDDRSGLIYTHGPMANEAKVQGPDDSALAALNDHAAGPDQLPVTALISATRVTSEKPVYLNDLFDAGLPNRIRSTEGAIAVDLSADSETWLYRALVAINARRVALIVPNNHPDLRNEESQRSLKTALSAKFELKFLRSIPNRHFAIVIADANSEPTDGVGQNLARELLSRGHAKIGNGVRGVFISAARALGQEITKNEARDLVARTIRQTDNRRIVDLPRNELTQLPAKLTPAFSEYLRTRVDHEEVTS